MTSPRRRLPLGRLLGALLVLIPSIAFLYMVVAGVGPMAPRPLGPDAERGPGETAGDHDRRDQGPADRDGDRQAANPTPDVVDEPGVRAEVENRNETHLSVLAFGSTGSAAGQATGSGGKGPLSVTNMRPGQSAVAGFTLANAGKKPLEYEVRGVYIGELAPVLLTTLKHDVTDCRTGGFNTDGTTAFGPSAVPATEGAQMTTLGPVRELASGEEEQVCIRVMLSPQAGNEYQGLTKSSKLHLNFISRPSR